MSRELLGEHLARRPRDNPVARFARALRARTCRELQAKGLAHYHAWAFATMRQLGAAFELAGAHLRWLDDAGARAGGRGVRHDLAQARRRSSSRRRAR